jgi:hypothetical protein
VFDGHGGKRAADFAKDHLPQVLSEELHADASDPGSCLIRAFEKTDEKFITGSDVRFVFGFLASTYFLQLRERKMDARPQHAFLGMVKCGSRTLVTAGLSS